MYTLGTNVMRLRTEQDLTKTAFAHMSGMTRPTLNKIEHGLSDPKLSCLQRLGDALCIDPILLLIASGDWSQPREEKPLFFK